MLFVLPVFALSFGAAIEDVAKHFGAPSLWRAPGACTGRTRRGRLSVRAHSCGGERPARRGCEGSPLGPAESVSGHLGLLSLLAGGRDVWRSPTPRDLHRPGIDGIGSERLDWHTPNTFPDVSTQRCQRAGRISHVCLLFSHEQEGEKADILAALKTTHVCSILLEETGAELPPQPPSSLLYTRILIAGGIARRGFRHGCVM